MKIFFLVSLILATPSYPQVFVVEKLSGNVKMLSGNSNIWQQLRPNLILNENAVISTDKNSSVKIKSDDITFTLKESSAITVANIKKMSLDDLILALAMEDVMDIPRKKENDKSDNTGVYGDKVTGETLAILKSSDFGIKRLNGAKQLAENGMKESAIITTKEVYRKYPDTKKDASFRIYFADLLSERGLYEEAYSEFNEIKLLQLNNGQISYVNNKSEQISKKLLYK
jgi:hypothetical protein